MNIDTILQHAWDNKASDVHLVVASPPVLRIDGGLAPMENAQVLDREDIEYMFRQVTGKAQQEIFEKTLELDFSYSMENGAHSRVNACFQQGSISLAFRLQPQRIPTISDLGLPSLCEDLVKRPRGLIVVSGPTGSGKSTTLAAMIQHLNNTEHRYIVTIEDPIEYCYVSDKSVFSQRELEADTHSFTNALKHVLRQDPDVILVGEMRDLDTVSAVLTLAETGHLILSTGHAPSAAQTVERIVDLFPPHERDAAQSRLASVLIGVLSQALVPRVGGGRIAAIEIMLANAPVKNLIREGKIHILPNTIRTHAELGMQMLDDALVNLFNKGQITWESVLGFCQDKTEVEKLAGKVHIGIH